MALKEEDLRFRPLAVSFSNSSGRMKVIKFIKDQIATSKYLDIVSKMELV